MANDINDFVDNMHLNISNSFTHMLNTENSDELNVIRYSPYITDDLLLQSRENRKRLSIVSLNCQSLHAKFDYIRLLIDKFMKNDCPLQAICLQETWFSPGNRSVTLHNPRVSYDLHWALCFKSWRSRYISE